MQYTYEIGIIAGIMFVVAFALLNFGVFTSTSPIYQALNFIGAMGFTYTAIAPFNPGLFITEFAWAVVAFFGLWKIISGGAKRKSAAASE